MLCGATITFHWPPITTCILCPHFMIATETFGMHVFFEVPCPWHHFPSIRLP